MKTALVTTTINLPKNLEGYFANFSANGHRDVDTIVIGDRKSPPETADYLARVASESGFAIDYWDTARQAEWLVEYPELDRLLPYNSVQRRNLAYLLAAQRGAECIITVDDDNFATDDDFLGGHGLIGQRTVLPSASSSRGWFNSSCLLRTEPQKPLYHRGFPTCKRLAPDELTYGQVEGRVVVNAGLWLGVPDADAMCHVDSPCDVIGFQDGFEGRLAVAHGDNMVFNSQNTAFHRDTLPAMFLMPQGDLCGHLVVGRYDDIWMGIFLKVIADHLGDVVCVGRPLVRQDRNEHDLIKDMLVEIPAQRITNTMTESLARLRLSGTDYGTCYRELVDQMRHAVAVDGYDANERAYLLEMYRRMDVWADVADDFLKTAS